MSFLFRLWGKRAAAFTIALFMLAPLQATAGKTFKSLYSFQGENDAVFPSGDLIRDKAGNLYGTAYEGGGTGCGGAGCGVVFKVTAAGLESILYVFQGGSDGWDPAPGLYQDAFGNLYGATYNGGGAGCGGSGCGTIFRISSSGTESILYTFSGGSDGAYPNGQLIADKNGNLYGTAQEGGFYGYGTIFEFSTSQTLTTLYPFEAGNDGAYPLAGVVADAQGNLYGTTEVGGPYGGGTIFKHASTGTETELYAFDVSYFIDFGFPFVSVALDTTGDIFLPVEGFAGCDVIFELAADGTAGVLYAFTGGADGCYAYQNNLIVDASGNLYGTTQTGGTGRDGTVFQLTPAGTITTLHSFSGKDGNGPIGGLVADTKHHLYGTTSTGGKLNDGTVFRVNE